MDEKIQQREDKFRAMKKTPSHKIRRKSFSNSYRKHSRHISRKLSLGNNIKLAYNVPKNSKPKLKSKKSRKSRTESVSSMSTNKKSKKRTKSI